MSDEIKNLPIREVDLTDSTFKAEFEYMLKCATVDQLKYGAQPLLASLSKYQYRSVGKPNAAEPKAIAKMRGQKKLKDDYKAFLLVFLCPSNVKYYLEDMPASMRQLFFTLANKHYLSSSEANKIGKCKVVSNERYWYADVAEELRLFLGSHATNLYKNLSQSVVDVFVMFKYNASYSLFFTAFYEQQKFEKPVLDGLLTFNAEEAIYHDIPYVASLYESGQLGLGTTRLRTKAFEKAVEKLDMCDFKIDSPDEWASYCSRRYFVPMLYTAYAKENVVDDLFNYEDIIRSVVRENDAYVCIFLKLFMPHIKGIKHNRVERGRVYGMQRLIENLFTKKGVDDWISVEQLCYMMRAFADDMYSKDFLLFSTYDFVSQKLVNECTNRVINLNQQVEEFSVVIVKSMLFALASWGVLEIAYSPTLPKTAVSPFDALKYVRLTKLGRYVYGLDNDYTSPIQQIEGKTFELADDRLLVKVLNVDSPRVLVLERFAQAVAPTLYKVEATYFMQGCQTKDEVEEKINQFKRLLGKDLPQIWTDFFDDLLMRCDAFSTVGKAYVIRRINKKDKRLQEIILTDSRLKSFTLRAEGYLILIEQKHMPDFTKIMREYGYML